VAHVSGDPLSKLNRLIVWLCMARRPRFFAKAVQLVFHIELPPLLHPVRMAHPYCIVVNPAVQLGKNVTLFQGVTIGGKRTGRRAGVPTIGDDVVIYANAVVVGAITIGAGAQVGPGAVVYEDVPPGCTVVGNPARPLVSKGD
jgi:serine acetyltransferase